MNGKTVFLCLLSLAFILPGDGVPAQRNIRKWGYLYHGAPLKLADFRSKYPDYSTVAITGYTLGASGLVLARGMDFRREYFDVASGKGPRCYPLIAFSDPRTGHRVLHDSRLRALCVKSTASVASAEKWMGAHFDFEYLPPSDCRAIARLMKEMRAALPGLTLSMAVFPQVEYPASRRQLHDLSLLASCADEFVIMCYDLHGPGTPPGPVTDLGWTRRNVEAALAHVKPERLWLGVPAYGYRWKGTGRPVAVSSRDGDRLASVHGKKRHSSGCAEVSIEAGGGDMVLYADARTRNEMQKVARHYGLAGTALWRLGFDK